MSKTQRIREFLRTIEPRPRVVSHEEVAMLAERFRVSVEYAAMLVRGEGIGIGDPNHWLRRRR